jgi:hypothetical protein
MRTVITITYLVCLSLSFIGCGKLFEPVPCHTYPEDTVEVCGKTHTLLAGKRWGLDSVILNGVNITEQVWDSLGASSYSIFISKVLEVHGFYHANAFIFVGNQGHEAEYVESTLASNGIDPRLIIVGEDSIVGKVLSKIPIAGIYKPIGFIRSINNSQLKLSSPLIDINNQPITDTIIVNYFSVK